MFLMYFFYYLHKNLKLIILSLSLCFIDDRDTQIQNVIYGNMMLSVLALINIIMQKTFEQHRQSAKFACYQLANILIQIYLRFLYTIRYYKIPNEMAEKYNLTIVYLRILTIVSVICLLIAALFALVIIIFVTLKICEECCPGRFSAHGNRFQSMAMNISNALSNVGGNTEIINYIITHVKQKKYSALEYPDLKDCPICLLEFTEGVEIIQLPCDNRHSFHAECIKTWISGQQKIICPICRRDVAQEIVRKQQEEEKKSNEAPQREIRPIPEMHENNQVVINIGNFIRQIIPFMQEVKIGN